MVVSSSPNRSSALFSSRTNPNSRSQECSGVRKSFSGDPFTKSSTVRNPRSSNPVNPPNSPADFSPRNSGHGEGLASLRVSYEQKENEKNQSLKPARVRSPAVSPGRKSFMAPTVSAASKINSSPRKKVLTERNEAVRTSITFSGGKSPFSAVNQSGLTEEARSESGTILGSKVHFETPRKSDATVATPVLGQPTVAANPEDHDSFIRGSFVNPEVPTETLDHSFFSPEPRTMDSRCIRSCISPSPVDMDPCLPPYDPKTNFLSPRPQFLRYKPNPRIEVYLNKDEGYDPEEGKPLEESFSLETSSDTETSEEFQSPSQEKEYEDAVSSKIMPEEENDNLFSEPELDITQDQNQVFQASKTQKPHLLARSKSVSLLLVLVVACLCFHVSDTPVHYSPLFKSQAISRFDYPPRIAEFAKAKFDAFSQDVKVWSASSVSYLSKLISSPNQMQETGPLEFVNSTSSDEKHLADLYHNLDYGYCDGREKTLDIETVEYVEEDMVVMPTNVESEEQPQVIVQASDLKSEILDEGEVLKEGNFSSASNNEPTNVEVLEKYPNTEVEEQSPLRPEVQDTSPVLEDSKFLEEGNFGSYNNIEPTNVEVLEKYPNTQVEEQSPLLPEVQDTSPVLEDSEFLEEGNFGSYNNIEPTNVEVLEKYPNTQVEEQSPLLPEVQDTSPVLEDSEFLEEGDFGSYNNIEPTNVEVPEKTTNTGVDEPAPLLPEILDMNPVIEEGLPEENDAGSDYSHGSTPSLDLQESSLLEGSNYRFPEKQVMGISSIVLTLLIAALLYVKQKKAPKVAAVSVEQLAAKKLSLCSVSASSDHLNQERRIWPAEVKEVSESSPSEGNSTLQGSSNRSKKASDGTNEVQSQERKPRRSVKRESLTSASEFSAGSLSYGSFTTYEKFQSKHKSGEEEVITPVRRSSRIKNHIATSP